MDIESLVVATQSQLSAVGDPAKAGPMATYMKTHMPFYGVQKAGRTPILRHLVRAFPPADADEYREFVRVLWHLEHREEKYLAIGYARAFDAYINGECIALYEQLIVDGAWWDFVDEIATKLVGRVLFKERADTEPIVRSWIHSDDMWLRRTSLICQSTHKADNDTRLLGDACPENLADREFFIRKAIGWSLQEYAKTEPDWVRNYVDRHESEISNLSHREATEHL